MAQNSDHHTQKITISKKTVKVTNMRDDVEFPKAAKKEGKYILPWETTEQPPDGMTNFRYFFTMDESKVPNEKKLNEEPLMQLMTADPSRVDNPPENGIRTTWLGHCSVLFQLDNVNLLVNPNFNQRGIKYYHPGDNKRFRSPVYKVDDLPRIDCVFITNTHFDYLDLTTVRLLNDRFGEMLLWYVPMGVADWMSKAGCVNVVELDWWKEDEVDFIDHTKLNEEDEDTKTTTFNIACTPSQSYHSRSFDDDNAVLWCSWVVISPRYKLFLSGATGYNDKVFKSIGRRYGPFHMAALPIGGYNPSWKFAFGNVTPEESVQIHQDVLAMCSLALSWGTFTLSNEFYLEPPNRLNEELRKQGLSEMQFFLLKHGESRLIEIKEADKDHPAETTEHEHVETVVNGDIHVAKADSYSSDDEHDKHATVTTDIHVDTVIDAGETYVTDAHAHGGTVEITTTETVITEDHDHVDVSEHTVTHLEGVINVEGETVITHTETVNVHSEGDFGLNVHSEGEFAATITIDDIPCMDDETHGDEHEHKHDNELEDEDSSMLQQLVDQFVDETQPEIDTHHGW